MCSELTPRARTPDTRIPQFMQPCLDWCHILALLEARLYWYHHHPAFNLCQVEEVGIYTARFLEALQVLVMTHFKLWWFVLVGIQDFITMQEYGLQLEDVHAIGFSYGSHVVGWYRDFIIVDINLFQDYYIFDISSHSSFLAANLGKELVRRGLRRLTRITCLDPGKIVKR